MTAQLEREAVKLVQCATTAGASLRLFGGVAIQLLVPDRPLPRVPTGDIDCAGLSRELRLVLPVFQSLGYVENLAVRRLFGRHRRVFHRNSEAVKVDLCLDVLLFSRALDLRKNLQARPLTLSVADLLLSKLQPRQITDNDVADVLSLLARFLPGSTESDAEFNLSWFLEPCGRDWGLFTLVVDNLAEVLTAASLLGSADRKMVESSVRLMSRELDIYPKSVRWRLRAALGKRMAYWNEVIVEKPQ